MIICQNKQLNSNFYTRTGNKTVPVTKVILSDVLRISLRNLLNLRKVKSADVIIIPMISSKSSGPNPGTSHGYINDWFIWSVSQIQTHVDTIFSG
jgi:hypothetical protein